MTPPYPRRRRWPIKPNRPGGIELIVEADLQRTLEDLLDWRGLLHFHDEDARRNDAGLPDLIWPEPAAEVLHLWELKTMVGQLEPPQVAWRAALERCKTVDYRVVRPSDTQWIREYLGFKEGA